MKKILTTICIFLIIVCCYSVSVFAVGDGNIDGGGGGMGSGTSNNVWSPGMDGVRVTVVRASDHAVVTNSIDLTNKYPNNIQLHFNKVSKMHYSKGVNLTPTTSKYKYINPAQAMPRIVSTNGRSNIDAIKKYFCSEYIIKRIAEITGMKYDVLIGGAYKLLLEPIAYYKFEGVMIATTATEAAMYDEKVSGLLRKRMVSLSHKNLPLAMFLEVSDLGYPAWNGSTTKAASNAHIKSSLGLGVVRFTEQPEPPVVSTYDYEYRVSTEVITSVMISGGQSDPDNPTRVSFHINGKIYNVGNIYYPEGDSQLAWVKWTTPDTEQNMNIDVSVKGPGGADKATIHCKIIDLDKNPPPNPVADDRNDDFSLSPIPQRVEKIRAEWTVWDPWWHEYWVWHSTGENSGYWCDHGWWEFNLNKFYAVFSADMKLLCDGKNPTANDRLMKSGYGINQQVSASVSSNQFYAVTNPQNAVSYFPEFNYNSYCRLLEQVQNGSNARFEFQKNKYSTYKNRTHFTPIWMPNGRYEVNTWVIDSWTPVGMMSKNLSDSLMIHGSLWDDWHVAPLKP